ncbi:MAG: 16S rRNA (adenine(1518)-N(6)/adenine(1519)-N(6))-dimethyltransferase RsmA [Proteobacteria bacterium]|nr:16S rRNA (adenine(1518)-N(6)/adenine(1519)-N(6))-dimethyltransferase RsmA [Pseudomonadota bacterium]
MGKRRLGQHFLFDKNILQKIINSFELDKSKNILEIGAGRGPLTELLALNYKEVFAIEYDNYLYDFLKEKFKYFRNVHIIQSDILNIDLETVPVSLAIGNIPYYITTPIIFKLIDSENIVKFGLLIQKEVAERIVSPAGSKDYGILTVMCNFYCQCKINFTVKRTVFTPPPKVDSSFITFIKKDVDRKKGVVLRDIVKHSFSMRRKTFYNNMKRHYSDLADCLMENFRIPKNQRPEEIEIVTYEKMAEFIMSLSEDA